MTKIQLADEQDWQRCMDWVKGHLSQTYTGCDRPCNCELHRLLDSEREKARLPQLTEGEAYIKAGKYELEIAKVIGDYEAGKYRIPIVKIIQRALLDETAAREQAATSRLDARGIHKGPKQ